MPAELILRAQVLFLLRRAEPGGLDTTFSRINYISASKISSLRIRTYESYSINPQTIICATSHVDYFI